MRKAAALFFALILGLSASAASAFPEFGSAAHMGYGSSFTLSDAQETADFTLAAHGGKVTALSEAINAIPERAKDRASDRPELGIGIHDGSINRFAFAAPTASDIVVPVVRKDAPAAAVSLSLFMGQANGDIFSSLHEQYAWRARFKSMTLGAGLYRDIPITKAIRIQPYVGFIRSQARLRTAGRSGIDGSFEYRLTMLCLGLPLVCGF